MQAYPLYSTRPVSDLQQMISGCVCEFPEREAFRVRKNRQEYYSITYKQFYNDLRALGNGLLEGEYGGKRIAVMGENSYEWVLVYLAAVNCNATIVPLDKELSGKQLGQLARRAQAAAFFYSDAYEEEALVAREILGESCVFVNLHNPRPAQGSGFLRHYMKEIDAPLFSTPFEKLQIDRERTCTILFTSGTTGESKGVMLCHRNLCANIMAACQMVGFEEGERVLSVLPIHHTYEGTCGILCMLHYGVTICMNDSLKNLPANLQLFRPTGMFLVPLFVETFYKKIWESARKSGKEKKLRLAIRLTNAMGKAGFPLKKKLFKDVHDFFGGQLRKIVCGGAYLNPALSRGFYDLGIPVLQGYGITECSPLVAVNRNEFYRPEAAGLVIPCCQVRIDTNEGGHGEVLVRGDNVMLGYFEQPEQTAQAFEGDWFRTGDIGYLDEQGFLYITGRCKNMIILKNGKNILPEELEALLLQEECVGEAVVMADLEDENGAGGLKALIYPNPAVCKELPQEQLEQLLQGALERVNREVPPYKRLTSLEIRPEEFPKNSSRKIMRHKI
jgi:long-chain acyl-CoA synthetase